jgi:hypothetical protein
MKAFMGTRLYETNSGYSVWKKFRVNYEMRMRDYWSGLRGIAGKIKRKLLK